MIPEVIEIKVQTLSDFAVFASPTICLSSSHSSFSELKKKRKKSKRQEVFQGAALGNQPLSELTLFMTYAPN